MADTYNFTALDVRDLSEMAADLLVGENLGFLSAFSEGPAPISTKHEWAQDDIKAQSTALTVAALVGDTTFTVADSSVFLVGDIINAVTTTGVSSLERVKILTLASPTSITVTRAIGSAAAAIPINATLNIISRPKLENNKTFSSEATTPATGFNYTQIFERSVDLSRTSQDVRHYAMGNNVLAYQEMLRMREIMVELNRAMIWGVRDIGTTSSPRRMGGLLEFATKVALNAALDSPTKINDVAELIVRNGGSADLLVCNTDIARKISAFNSGTSNLRTQLAERDAGSFVARFVGDTPVSGIQRLVVDTDFPRDMLAICDSSRLERNTLMNFQSLNATVPGQDGVSRVIRGEVTSTWKNAATVQRVITNITL